MSQEIDGTIIAVSDQERRTSDAFLRASQAARDLSTALLSAQLIGLTLTVEVEWVSRDGDVVQDVVVYLPSDDAELQDAKILHFPNK